LNDQPPADLHSGAPFHATSVSGAGGAAGAAETGAEAAACVGVASGADLASRAAFSAFSSATSAKGARSRPASRELARDFVGIAPGRGGAGTAPSGEDQDSQSAHGAVSC
jgi:hypothetical protein